MRIVLGGGSGGISVVFRRIYSYWEIGRKTVIFVVAQSLKLENYDDETCQLEVCTIRS